MKFALAVDQAGVIADQLNRIFIRALRQFQHYGMCSSAVILQAGQLRIWEQQINMAGGRIDTADEARRGMHPSILRQTISDAYLLPIKCLQEPIL